jgi:hypothetical protein
MKRIKKFGLFPYALILLLLSVLFDVISYTLFGLSIDGIMYAFLFTLVMGIITLRVYLLEANAILRNKKECDSGRL